MKILALKFSDGSVTLVDTPAPLLAPGCVRVRTLCSAVSPGTEGNKIVTGKKSLLGKAKARPDQVRMVLDMARTVGVKATLQKVRSKLEGAQGLGYSSAGEVIEVGEGVETLQVGDMVACAGGYANHADEIVVPVNLTAKVPAGVGVDAAAMTTLASIAMQGVRLAEPTLGENALVIGLGVVGLMAGQLLKANGCRVFGTDIAPAALELATGTGSADEVGLLGGDSVEAQLDTFSRGRGVDLVLICAATASDDPVTMAGRVTRQRGRVVVVGAVGMDLPREDYYRKEINFQVSCSYGPGRYDPTYEEGGTDYPHGFVRWTEGRNMEAVLDLVAAGRFDPVALVTHRYTFDQAPAAYELLANRNESFAGILLDYPDRPASSPVIRLDGAAAKGAGDIGVGCIGAGSYAQAFLLPHFAGASGVALRSIFTRTGLSAVDAGQRLGFAQAVDNEDAVLGDAETDAVVLATRHDQHGPGVLAALARGKHVFVEKPLCLNETELGEIARQAAALEADEKLPVVQTGFNRRFSPAAVEVRKHLGRDPGPLAMMYRVSAGVIPRDHWIQVPAAGGGRIIGEVCHFIDLMQFVCGADPVSVHATCVGADDPGQSPHDTVLITLRFADGSIGTVGYFAHGAKGLPKEWFEASAGGRTAVIDNYNAVILHGEGGRSRKRCPGKGQEQEVAAFLEGIREGRQPIPLQSQLATTLATFKALESLRSGKAERVDLAELH
ncbi:hypothetical protein DRQ50_01340 [bacterium]|nr:MAG: hypothetical protein DRQ50_01340 [bacterium]